MFLTVRRPCSLLTLCHPNLFFFYITLHQNIQWHETLRGRFVCDSWASCSIGSLAPGESEGFLHSIVTLDNPSWHLNFEIVIASLCSDQWEFKPPPTPLDIRCHCRKLLTGPHFQAAYFSPWPLGSAVMGTLPPKYSNLHQPCGAGLVQTPRCPAQSAQNVLKFQLLDRSRSIYEKLLITTVILDNPTGILCKNTAV